MSDRTAILRLGAAVAGLTAALLAAGWWLAARGDAGLVERGRQVFWGRGRCSGCHAIDGQGGGIRCPDLGADGSERLAARAAGRVPGLSAVEYLVQSVYDPRAYTVDGYPPGLMPAVDLAPLSLDEADVAALVAYLLDDRRVGPAVAAAQARFGPVRAGRVSTVAEVAGGDPGAGQEVFERMKCAACHVIEGLTPFEDATVVRRRGPDLTGIGSLQGTAYLEQAVWEPNAVVVPGPGRAWVSDDGHTSRMPSYREQLRPGELGDLVAFLSSLR